MNFTRKRKVYNATTAFRQSLLRNKERVPKWANLNYLNVFYTLAKEQKAEVDHIVPLHHPLVCGLHVEHNLQLVTKTYNKFKSNLFWSEMPEYNQSDYLEIYAR